MKIDDFFPSKYLKASDLNGEDLDVTIKQVEGEQFEDGKKPVLHFEEPVKPFIVNRTNFTSISNLHGKSTEMWIGKRITLFPTEVSYRGNPTLGIRVRLTVPEAAHSTEKKEDVPF